MGRKAKDTTVEVREGVFLKQIAGVWHCYFRLGSKQFRKSAKTRDLGDAKLASLGWYRDAQNKRTAGEEIDRISFARLKREYLAQIGTESKAKYHRETIERHFLPFFAKFDDVSRIKGSDIQDYLKFRKAKGETVPVAQTINRENTALRQMLRFAVERGWMKQAALIRNESERLTRHRRRHFTSEEYGRLYRTARKRTLEFEHVPLKRRQHWQRLLLYDVVMLLANTGMRVDEYRTLIWRNVDLESGTLLLEKAGKTKSNRRVVMRKSAVDALRRIRSRRIEFLARGNEKLDDAEKVIALANGKAVGSLKRGFERLLEAAGFKYASVKERHALTSLRHSYATFRLTTKFGERASVRALSKQMGTSERMIERHYGHDSIEDYREELAGISTSQTTRR